jgi:hypothetical protein
MTDSEQPTTRSAHTTGKIQRDSAGLLLHTSGCGVVDSSDDDFDCTCGAHAINQRLNGYERLRAAVLAYDAAIQKAAEQGRQWVDSEALDALYAAMREACER